MQGWRTGLRAGVPEGTPAQFTIKKGKKIAPILFHKVLIHLRFQDANPDHGLSAVMVIHSLSKSDLSRGHNADDLLLGDKKALIVSVQRATIAQGGNNQGLRLITQKGRKLVIRFL